MKVYFKQIQFPSTKKTYFLDITDTVNKAIKKAKVNIGLVLINSKHTTLGVVVQEIAEPNLIRDFLEHTLQTVPEDKRSTRVTKGYLHPTTDYRHRCQDNPYCDEIDEDYNAGAHLRALTFSHSSVTLSLREGKLELGKYQRVALFEFDGRDGKGKNPVRQRTAQIWIYPSDEIKML